MAEPYTKCADAQCELDQYFPSRSNRPMNGSNKIEIFTPFAEAFELMKKILFQPFDLKKWLVIGFAAWLSNLGSGNYNYNYRGRSDWKDVPFLQDLDNTFNQIPHWILFTGLAIIIALALALIILFAWLRARGRFMFVDCIVKNRGAIVQPWREFREQGNSYFLLGLLVGVVIAVIVSVASLPFMLPIIRGVTFAHPDAYLICIIAVWGILLILLILAWSLISHFMVAVMYRRRCLAVEAFRVALSLIANYPGEITLYCLFWIVLGIAAVITACATILATCCIALIPYIGTVILLPLFVCLRAFGLRFIRQFGPDYDVWAVMPEASPTPTSSPPPLPS